MTDKKNLSIGIASSLAIEHHYSWAATIKYARQFNINLVQLYINLPRLKTDIAELASIDFTNLEIVLHLPTQPVSGALLSDALSTIPNVSIIIQHENSIDVETIKLIRDSGRTLGVENDNPYSADSYLKKIQTLFEGNINFIPVLDLPRFFHQYSSQYSVSQIEKIIYDLIKYISEIEKPIVIHLIDSVGKTGNRNDWRPLFEGDLPLANLFRKIGLLIGIHSIVLEYESVEMTEKSLSNLRAFLKECNIKYEL